MIKKYIVDRKIYWLVGIILALAEIALCIWPVGLLREDMHFFLGGVGRGTFETADAPTDYYQSFVPTHKKLKSIELFFENQGQDLSEEGYAVVQIVSETEDILFEKNFSYSELSYDEYMEIPVNLQLHSDQNYVIHVQCVTDVNGKTATLGYCSREEYLQENQFFSVGEADVTEIQDEIQLLTGYQYTEALDRDAVIKVLVLVFITFLGVGLGVPDNKYLKILLGSAILVAAPLLLGQRLELLTINTMFLLPNALKWNMAIMFLCSVVVLLVTLSFRWSIILTYTLLTIIYTANYFVLMYRGVALKANDIYAIGTAADVVGNYSLTPNKHIVMAWCILVVLVVYGWQCGGVLSVIKSVRERSIKKIAVYISSVIIGIALGALMVYNLIFTDLLTDNGFVKFAGFDQQMIYHFNGYLVSTCIDIKESIVTEPEGYSVQNVEEILQNVQENAEEGTAESTPEEELPHVILIMNESFSDLRDLGNLEISEENMGFFYSLQENTIRGYARTSVLGGGTANSEFEVFTGCSLGLLPVSYYGYQQGMFKERNSLISLMEDAGYTTYAVHPESKENWNRGMVYQYFGFDHTYWEDEFDGAERIHSGVSDLETYYFIENVFENLEDDEKMFLFGLTMQNHGGYTNETMERTVTSVNAPCDEADVYLSLIKESDQAFEQLINYFKDVDDKVIICMYGDHQPSFSDDSFVDKVYAATEGLSEIDQKMNQYKVPFVLWANYDIEEQTNYDISLNYLGVLLAQETGITMSPFFSFLEDYMEQYPIITTQGYIDAEGTYYPWSGQNDEHLEYRYLQYNYLFDDDIVTK